MKKVCDNDNNNSNIRNSNNSAQFCSCFWFRFCFMCVLFCIFSSLSLAHAHTIRFFFLFFIYFPLACHFWSFRLATVCFVSRSMYDFLVRNISMGVCVCVCLCPCVIYAFFQIKSEKKTLFFFFDIFGFLHKLLSTT